MPSVVNHPYTRVSVYQCPSCSRIIRDDVQHVPYLCPWGCGSRLEVLRTEYEARGTQQKEAAEYLRDEAQRPRESEYPRSSDLEYSRDVETVRRIPDPSF